MKITAEEIDNNKKQIIKNVETELVKFVKQKLSKAVRELRTKKLLENPKWILTKEQKDSIKKDILNDDETKAYQEYQFELQKKKSENYFVVRETIQDLNELNEFSADLERTGLQLFENFKSYKELIQLNITLLDRLNKYKSIRKNNIDKYLESYKNKKLSFIESDENLINLLQELYIVTKDYDDIDLFDKFDLQTNIDLSNKLGDYYLHKYVNSDNNNDSKNNNIINNWYSKTFNSEITLNKVLDNVLDIKKQLITNKLLGQLFLTNSGTGRTTFITNNSVTCYNSMYVTTKNNKYTYVTRTLGELLLMITNPKFENIDKSNRQQIYSTYDGSRPTSDEYYKWNGLQVFDIDLKEWNQCSPNMVEILKKKIFEYLNDFHWFLWIAKSASGKGIHIYTKVSPPHHIYTDVSKNEYISKYWFNINYAHKSSIIYDVLYRINIDKSNTIHFEENDFIDGFELRFLDNVVRRITAGIRLTWDNNILINHDFLDLHPSIGLSESLRGDIWKIFLRDTKFQTKLIEHIDNELRVNKVNDIKQANNIEEIDLSKYEFAGELSQIQQISRGNINYNIRYHVCNTLASLFGKEGLTIAHFILQSELCKNVKEINSFYTCAISNKKEPSKLGLDILKKVGVIKQIKSDVKQYVDNKYKNHIRKLIENSLDNPLEKPTIELKDNEYLGDRVNELTNPLKGGFTNNKVNVLLSPPGTGKCLGKDTLVMMYDGSTKKVQDVKVGDKLMGPDSKPRKVLSTCTGKEELFEIIPEYGDKWVCNKSHILSLIEKDSWEYKCGKTIDTELIKDISISDLQNTNYSDKRLFRVPINFKKQKTHIKPFLYGITLSNSFITRINSIYLLNNRKSRLEFFSGILLNNNFNTFVEENSYYITVKSIYLKEKIIWLCRSLGYFVKILFENQDIFKLQIFGNFKDLPGNKIKQSTKNYLETKFEIKSIGVGDYYGFEIDGDKRFLLGDLTVTHNTQLLIQLAKSGKRILLVEPFISVIKNKVEKDENLMKIFQVFYGDKKLDELEPNINAVSTFDKFSKCNYEKLSRMFDYICIDESHLLFTSSYRIEATSQAVKKIKELFFISSNDPFAAKIIMMTGTETGESFYFGEISNIIRVSKKSLDKQLEFLICNDNLDSVTRLSYKVYQLLNEGYRLLIPTNKGEIYANKLIGMVEYLLGRQVKFGYYKRSNTEQEICRLINDSMTVGDYEIIFCSNYLSVGVDIVDKLKFASIYFGPFSGFEVEQFNARIRRTGIKSIYCVQTEKNDGTTSDILIEEPKLALRITDEDVEQFNDDKQIAKAKQTFLAEYDPILHKITTPGFSYLNGAIRFNLEEYELVTFENKYLECMSHPVKVARELSKYGYKITVSPEYDGLPENKQEELKKIGTESARQEKIRKHNLLVGTFIDLVENNYHKSEEGLEFVDILSYIGKHRDIVFEDREQEEFVKIIFNVFAVPEQVIVKSREAFEAMYVPAKYLINKYSVSKSKDIILQYVDDNGILKQKYFKRAINLLKLIDKSESNDLSEPVFKSMEKIYDWIDKFMVNKSYRISYNSYQAQLDSWTNEYIDMLGISVTTTYGYDKIRDSLVQMLNDIGMKNTSKDGIRFEYNKLPYQDGALSKYRKSIDTIIENMFSITNEVVTSNKRIKQNHIILTEQEF